MSLLQFGIATHVGLVRSDNQDSAGCFPPEAGDDAGERGVLVVVADGMGGHKGGKIASDIAVRTLSGHFAGGDGDLPDRLRGGFEEANAAIAEYGDEHPECRGLGTTMSALAMKDGQAYVGHVGDSRIYRVRKGEIAQLTEDHSVVAEWLRKGWITEEQAKTHPERSLLFRALGVTAEVAVDILGPLAMEHNDRFLLCSDGLTNHVAADEICAIVWEHAPQEACDMLVALALERGGYDNITVQLVSVAH
jgi:protein phosphatase